MSSYQESYRQAVSRRRSGRGAGRLGKAGGNVAPLKGFNFVSESVYVN